MMRKIFKGFVFSILGAFMLMGCGNDNVGDPASEPEDTTGTSEEGIDINSLTEQHADISWMVMLHAATPPTNVVIEEIESKTNTSLDILWVPDAARDERINTGLVSGELADIVTLTDLNNSSVRGALASGMFWEVGEYLDQFHYLSMITQERRESAAIEGNLYGVPIQSWQSRSGLTIRKDWLDQLGLEVPRTVDELFEVAQAFSNNDELGSSWGWVGRNNLSGSGFTHILTALGGPVNWGMNEDGEFYSMYETEAWVETMDFFRELYENNYINQDWAVTATAEQNTLFAQGQAGIFPGMAGINSLYNETAEMTDDFELVPVVINGPDGEPRVPTEGNGIGGLLAFPKSYVETEEDLLRILAFVDQMISEELYYLTIGGIPGVHHEIDEDGIYQILDQDAWQQDAQPLSSLRPSVITYRQTVANPSIRHAHDLIEANENYVVIDPSRPYNSETFNERGTELNQLIEDATVRYIMGVIDLDEFNSVLDDWRERGGTKIAEEFTENYREING